MDDPLDRFTTAKQAAGLAPRTVAWYRWMVMDYRRWACGQSLPEDCTETVEWFLASKRQAGVAGATTDGYYRALNAYFGWMVRRQLLAPGGNPMDLVERPRVPRKRMRYVSVEDFTALYQSIDGPAWPDARDRALLLILFYSGLRIAELIALRRQDIDAREQMIAVNAGKGGDGRMVPCAPVLGVRIHEYLCLLPSCSLPTLWASNDGVGGVRGQMTIDGVRQMLKRRCRRAGIEYMNPHAFRHGFGMTLLNAGMPMSAVAAAMGHKSVATTERIYARWLTAGLKREYAQAMRRIQE